MVPRHFVRRCHVTLPYASLSCTKIESPHIRRKLFAFGAGFVIHPILTTPIETFRPTSLFRYAAAMPCFIPASADADCDNGAGLHGTPRCGGWDRCETRCVDKRRGTSNVRSGGAPSNRVNLYAHCPHMVTGTWSSGVSKSRFSSTCTGLCGMLDMDFGEKPFHALR